MTIVNIHEAKTHLSRLIEKAVRGAPFVIAKAGKPLVTVTAITPDPVLVHRRIGGMEGMFQVPDDFDTMAADEIARMFEGDGECGTCSTRTC